MYLVRSFVILISLTRMFVMSFVLYVGTYCFMCACVCPLLGRSLFLCVVRSLCLALFSSFVLSFVMSYVTSFGILSVVLSVCSAFFLLVYVGVSSVR